MSDFTVFDFIVSDVSVTDIIWEKWYKCGKTFSNSSSGFTLMSSRFTLTLNCRL